MKSIKILMAIVLLLSTLQSIAEIKNSATENVKIAGSCALCKSGIETAALQKNVSQANWNADTKMAAITYDSQKTSVGTVLKKLHWQATIIRHISLPMKLTANLLTAVSMNAPTKRK